MENDSIKKILLVSVGVCLVCSLFVSMAAVTLNAIQAENVRLDKIKNILIAGGLYGENVNLAKTYDEKIKPIMIDLDTGNKVNQEKFNDELNIEGFDIIEIASHPEYGKNIPQENDQAKIKRMPKYMVVYIVEENEELQKIILPIYGRGLWSTMYGFLALEKDLKTISGITFYAHGETPGLGGEIENPRWTSIWEGKNAYNDEGNVVIEVLKGQVDRSRPQADHQIDGLTGATITTRGVDQMVKFWLGENGYGEFLEKLKDSNA
jgi:Na+-transporting NADH:ubiquinone oxidoreductase subunit C